MLSGRVRLIVVAVAAGAPLAAAAAAQTPSPNPAVVELRAFRTLRPPVIDGRLSDEGWAGADVASHFVQVDPEEGRPATERTEVRVLYDDEALYVGARLFDGDATGIARRLSPRDGDADADRIAVYLDSMHDHLTGAVFRVSASNVQQDAILHNDTWSDSSWDAVWQSQVSIDPDGWSVEMRLPLSQLRFPRLDRQTWGLNVERFIRRKNETVWLAMVPKRETGLASRMMHLTGLDGLRPRRNLELLPYTAARAEFIAPQKAGNPFNDGSRTFASAGLDVKWGLTSNLTVNATANPDFGQVEVDPAVINLTAFETFFQEKRTFFLEGSQIFNNFGTGGSNNFWGFNTADPNIFYSRRIGRAPQLDASGDHADSPAATTILGAVKLTGKTGGGWSLGLLEAVTDRETARTRTGSATGREAIEPLTNYAVVRVQREIGRRGGVGLMGTAVTRRLTTTALRDGLASDALVAGADAHLFLDASRDWVLTGKIAGSRVAGTPAVIARLQQAPQRYYQRPDAAHVALDPSLTSLTGVTGRLNLNRNSGLWQINAALWGVSPGFESNDLGFQSMADRAGAHAVSLWRGVNPNRWTRSRFLWVAKWWTWNYGRELQGDGYNTQAGLTFLNYWSVSASTGGRRRVLDDRLTRGGPSAVNPAGGFWNVNGGTDSRRWISAQAFANYNWSDASGWSRTAGLSLSLKPSPIVTISTGPHWNRSNAAAQYVRSVVDPTAAATGGGRYVFGTLDQTQLTLTTRVNVVLTPAISVQVFAQPLLAAGDYTRFKELAQPRTFDFLEYGGPSRPVTFDPLSKSYTVDPDGAGGSASPFTFADPDFNVKSLRVNAVFRWELKPGSIFYAVWTRQQEDLARPGRLALGRDARALITAPGDDVVLLKMAYWLGR